MRLIERLGSWATSDAERSEIIAALAGLVGSHIPAREAFVQLVKGGELNPDDRVRVVLALGPVAARDLAVWKALFVRYQWRSCSPEERLHLCSALVARFPRQAWVDSLLTSQVGDRQSIRPDHLLGIIRSVQGAMDDDGLLKVLREYAECIEQTKKDIQANRKRAADDEKRRHGEAGWWKTTPRPRDS
jgi:hypothetical protein